VLDYAAVQSSECRKRLRLRVPVRHAGTITHAEHTARPQDSAELLQRRSGVIEVHEDGVRQHGIERCVWKRQFVGIRHLKASRRVTALRCKRASPLDLDGLNVHTDHASGRHNRGQVESDRSGTGPNVEKIHSGLQMLNKEASLC
jgi:hypothetical protein